jgi:hypothetical protein
MVNIYVHNEMLAIKKTEIMLFLVKWIEMEIMLSEINQSQKAKYYIFLFICGI